MIPYGKQDITSEDIEAVVDVLRSDFVTQGPIVPKFEAAIAKYCGAKHAVAANSATSSLHLACLALGLGKGDWLWTSPITFVASANCGLYCGARVEFVDIDPKTYNLCPLELERKLVAAEKVGRLPKVVVVVHLCGQPCDMLAINKLSRQFGFRVIEDASHAIGGQYRGEAIGNCRYSDITVFSFHPVKIITTGEGGMSLTNDPGLAEKMELYRSHGITRNPERMIRESEGPWYYQQTQLGFNYRMTEFQAALGLSQLNRLDAYVARRHDLAKQYDIQLAHLPIQLPDRDSNDLSAFHLYVVVLHEPTLRRAVFESLRAAGIGVNVHYIPVHLQPYYEAMGFCAGDFPKAEAYYAGAISLPLFVALTENQQRKVVSSLVAALC